MTAGIQSRRELSERLPSPGTRCWHVFVCDGSKSAGGGVFLEVNEPTVVRFPGGLNK